MKNRSLFELIFLRWKQFNCTVKFTLEGSFKEPVKDEHPLKAEFPISSTDSGIVNTQLNPEHLENAIAPILVTESGMINDPTNPEYPSKAYSINNLNRIRDTQTTAWNRKRTLQIFAAVKSAVSDISYGVC